MVILGPAIVVQDMLPRVDIGRGHGERDGCEEAWGKGGRIVGLLAWGGVGHVILSLFLGASGGGGCRRLVSISPSGEVSTRDLTRPREKIDTAEGALAVTASRRDEGLDNAVVLVVLVAACVKFRPLVVEQPGKVGMGGVVEGGEDCLLP